MDPARPPAWIGRPPGDAEAWVARFDPMALPVLPSTATALEQWRAREEAADAHMLSETIAADPLMALKVFVHVAGVRSGRGASGRGGDAETVTAALVLLGIGPFFRAFGPQQTVDEWLAAHPPAQAGFDAVLRRAYRAAAFALAFAAHRLDPDAAVIHAAALLHEAPELLLWLHAPALALEMAARQAADPGLRSARVQREVLHAELADIGQAMLRRWQLPPLLVRITDDRHADDAQVRSVLLAVRLARHTAQGWDNPALPDDVQEISRLLQLGEAPTLRLLRGIDDGG